MSRIEEIRAKLKELCSKGAPQPTMLGVVKSVNEKEQTCVVEDDGLEYPKVRLSPVLTSSDGLTIIPVVGKYALCARIENDNEWYLVDAEEIYKYRLKVAQTVFEVTALGVRMSKGKDSLKSCMDDLFTAISSLTVMCNPEGSPSGTPMNLTAFKGIQIRLNNILE